MKKTIDKKDLLALLTESEQLDVIKNKFQTFNLFESLGMVRQEIKHSNAMATIFDSFSGIGLSDDIFKSFIRFIYENNETPNGAIDRFEFELAQYDDLEVFREYRNIDLLIRSKKNNHLFVIENKVDAQESEHQLENYKCIVESDFKENEKLYIFLSPEGVDASNSELWLTATYQNLIDAISNYLNAKQDISDDKRLFLKHYIQMVRRHILEDEQLTELAMKIYQKHKDALDYIYEKRPDLISLFNAEFENKLQEEDYFKSSFELDHSTKNYMRIAYKKWDDIPSFLSGGGLWTKSKRVLLWELNIRDNSIALKLVLGPSTDDEYRDKLKTSLQNNIDRSNKSSSKKFTQIKTFFNHKVDFNDKGQEDLSELASKISAKVKKYISDEKLHQDILNALYDSQEELIQKDNI